ncbi:cysteine--tRNA ligase [Rhizobium sp. G21]|uniref:cysteine--tRNA ligase n=1 Tax=Rhizobium sp. G21 TaxID=2758439 RepID=UPI001602BB20|nr:cysteine--tRNA ligase [Rhizobium sp. G21]MBB1248180.1 cysteine--tRNA ligase [Rhizobium sp. G21]
MADTPELRLYNTLTREKAPFQPIDPSHVRMYVCGPTVYDFAHIGNARPVIVFDVLYRLLKHLADKGVWDGGKGETKVTYVRNITDVDDKINARALRDYPGMELNAAIRLVTEKTETQFHEDVKALGCLPPDVEPRATDNITQMIDIIQKLLDRGHAYVADGAEGREVLFSTGSMADYGQLSKRKLEDQQAGARVAVEAHKRNPADFVLWKHSDADQPGWPARFSMDGAGVDIYGRPGWHIECSAMSGRYLGDVFDIHGGGLDLIFPHHENEIAQSRCAHGTHAMANVWMHNGFLQVEGKKMSKSEGNFFTINELMTTENFGGRKWPGEVLRLAMLMTHYREPIDFSVKRLEEAERLLAKWPMGGEPVGPVNASVLSALADDMNTVAAVQALHALASSNSPEFAASAELLGVLPKKVAIDQHLADGVEAIVQMRLELLKAKNFAEADKIRDDLLVKGIQLKDGKDPATGERVTTWEIKR